GPDRKTLATAKVIHKPRQMARAGIAEPRHRHAVFARHGRECAPFVRCHIQPIVRFRQNYGRKEKHQKSGSDKKQFGFHRCTSSLVFEASLLMNAARASISSFSI